MCTRLPTKCESGCRKVDKKKVKISLKKSFDPSRNRWKCVCTVSEAHLSLSSLEISNVYKIKQNIHANSSAQFPSVRPPSPSGAGSFLSFAPWRRFRSWASSTCTEFCPGAAFLKTYCSSLKPSTLIWWWKEDKCMIKSSIPLAIEGNWTFLGLHPPSWFSHPPIQCENWICSVHRPSLKRSRHLRHFNNPTSSNMRKKWHLMCKCQPYQ